MVDCLHAKSASSRAARAVFFTLGMLASVAALAQDKVVFQVSDADPAKWNLVLNNVRNLQSGAGPDADVEVVAFGPGITLLKADSPLAARVTEAVGNKVRIVACENSMAGARLSRSDMLSDIGFVPSGVVEVMRKQQQGYAYIRP